MLEGYFILFILTHFLLTTINDDQWNSSDDEMVLQMMIMAMIVIHRIHILFLFDTLS